MHGDTLPGGWPSPQPLGQTQQLPHWGSVHGVEGLRQGRGGLRQQLGDLQQRLGGLQQRLGGLQQGLGLESQLQSLLRGS